MHTLHQIAHFLQESSQSPLKAGFLALKCFIKDELNDIRETIEKVSEKFDQIFYREYTNLTSLLTENVNSLSRSHSQSQTYYQPQKHNVYATQISSKRKRITQGIL